LVDNPAVNPSNAAAAAIADPAIMIGLFFVNVSSCNWERSDPPIIPVEQTRPPKIR